MTRHLMLVCAALIALALFMLVSTACLLVRLEHYHSVYSMRVGCKEVCFHGPEFLVLRLYLPGGPTTIHAWQLTDRETRHVLDPRHPEL